MNIILAIMALGQICGPGGCSTGNCGVPQSSYQQFSQQKRTYSGPLINRSSERTVVRSRKAPTYVPPQGTSTTDVPVVKVNNNQWAGSGTIISDDRTNALVLSCGHLFRESVGVISVTVGNKKFPGEMVKLDVDKELSLIRISSPGVGVHPMTRTNSQPGEFVKAMGYSGGVFGFSIGVVQTYKWYTGNNTWMTCSFKAPSGFSGGPVFNQNYYVVGVIWGTDSAVPIETIHEFLSGIYSPPVVNPPGISPPILPLPEPQNPPILPEPGPAPECSGIEELRNTIDEITEFHSEVNTYFTTNNKNWEEATKDKVIVAKRLVKVEEEVERIDSELKYHIDTSINLEDRVIKLESDVQTLLTQEPVQGPPGEKGEKGEKGDKGDPGEKGDSILPLPTINVSHIVLVSPSNGPYWDELKKSYYDAKKHFSDIIHVVPTKNVGPMPALVIYDSGNPVWKTTGVEGVMEALDAISNDAFSFLKEE